MSASFVALNALDQPSVTCRYEFLPMLVTSVLKVLGEHGNF